MSRVLESAANNSKYSFKRRLVYVGAEDSGEGSDTGWWPWNSDKRGNGKYPKTDD